MQGAEVQFVHPWVAAGSGTSFESQLARELPERHVLAGLPVQAIAHRVDCDDVLFALLDGTSRLAIVHLTYSNNNTAPWPATELFDSIHTWLRHSLDDSTG